ncbi:MAG: hypothetical protein II823_07150, partial [Kiritimatiellae bacterium]|nr:hypothetical protein [Kiritimatiellia bacterium]
MLKPDLCITGPTLLAKRPYLGGDIRYLFLIFRIHNQTFRFSLVGKQVSNCKFKMKFSVFVLGCGILSQARQHMEKTGRRMRGAGGKEEG